jgi:hypothetical protein
VCANPSGVQKLVAWTTGEQHTITLSLDGDIHASIGTLGNGEHFSPTLTARVCTLELTSAPRYLALGNSKLN